MIIDEQRVYEQMAMLERLAKLLPKDADPKHQANIEKVINDHATFRKHGDSEGFSFPFVLSMLVTFKYCRENVFLNKADQVLFDELNSFFEIRKNTESPRE